MRKLSHSHHSAQALVRDATWIPIVVLNMMLPTPCFTVGMGFMRSVGFVPNVVMHFVSRPNSSLEQSTFSTVVECQTYLLANFKWDFI